MKIETQEQYQQALSRFTELWKKLPPGIGLTKEEQQMHIEFDDLVDALYEWECVHGPLESLEAEEVTKESVG